MFVGSWVSGLKDCFGADSRLGSAVLGGGQGEVIGAHGSNRVCTNVSNSRMLVCEQQQKLLGAINGQRQTLNSSSCNLDREDTS